ncbi:MAG: UDP-glucose 4-epimerase GalE [Candidatus Omnitrophica bacterium]|nr:UDP-glucose 4-epimerase GalE [Candidatus Omnitrophota bacterium]
MILITGGAGYIGSHVNKELSRKGYDTIVLDNLVHGHEESVKWGKLVKGDLSDEDLLDDIFGNNDIEAVMHFAAYAYVGESVEDPQKYYLNNVKNALNLLKALNASDTRHFIFSSTCATYGVPEEVPITEDHSQKPVNPYGRGKLMIERVLRDYSEAYGLKYASLRYFNAAGADPGTEIGEDHDPETHLIPLVLAAASGARENVEIYGTDYPTPDGTCVRDYIHVSDLAGAHIKALENLKRTSQSDVFNLGNGNGFSVREVISAAEKVTGSKINAVEAPRRPGDPAVLVGSAQKAREILGWQPRYDDLSAIIETAWKWHKKNR